MANDLRLRVLLDAVDRVTGPMKKIMGGTAGAAKAMRAAQGDLKRLNEAQRNLDGFRELKQGTQGTAAALEAAKRRLHSLSAEVRTSETVSRKLGVQHRAAGREVQALTQKHAQQQTRLNALRNTLGQAGIKTRDLAGHQRKLKTDIATANAAIDTQKKRLWSLHQAQAKAQKLQNAGLKAGAVGAGMAFAGQRVLRGAVAPIAAAMQFESALADVRKVVDFESPQQFKQMARDIQDLSIRLPITSEGIAQIVAAAGQANIPRAELLRFAEDASKMGVAFDSTAEESGQTMATWRTAFRLNQEQVVELADKINYLGNTGPANVAKISDVVNRVGALGEIGGLASGQVAALGATIAGMGVGSEVSGTGIKNLILRLTAGSAATKRQRTAFKALGLDAVKMANHMQKDAGGAILLVLERLRALPKAQQNATMSQLFGTESVGAIAPLLTNLELLQTNFAKVADAQQYAGSMNKEYASRVATSENSLQLLKNTASVLAQSLGETLIPDFKALAEGTGKMVARVAAWSRDNPRLVKTLALVAIVGAALVTVVGGLLIVFGMMAASVVALSTAIPVLSASVLPALGAAFMAVGRAMLLNPIGLLLTLIAALIYVVWKNWDTIGPMLVAVWDAVGTAVAVAWDWMKAKAVWLWEALKLIFGWSPLGMIISNWGAILAFMSNLWTQFKAIGGQIMLGLVGGLLGGLGKVKETILNVGTKVTGWFKGKLGINSPSRVFAQFGDYTMQGLAGGLDRSRNLPVSSLAAVAGSMRKVGAGIAIGAATMPAVAVDSRPPLAPGAGASSSSTSHYEIHIHAAAGDSAEAIARAVTAELDRRDRERAAKKRSRLGDYD